jgi:uncharacterized protein (DUF1800 family)
LIALGAADDYGLLVSDAVDSYRALLEAVTLHPAMGLSLNMTGNRKAAPVLGTVPDQNYAREVLQLFSVGLWAPNPDGSRVLDAAGEQLPSYSQAHVMELAPRRRATTTRPWSASSCTAATTPTT